MSSTSTQSITMANVKPEDTDNPIWQGYSLQTPTSASSHLPPFETSYLSGPSAIPYHGRPQRSSYRSLDIPSMQTRPPPQDGNGPLTASPPNLNSHHSYPSLKRTFQNTEESPYGEVVQDFREEIPDIPKPSINQDHRLLSFTRVQEKHTIIDNNGRMHQFELSAQIHGMFFLSEMSTPGGEGMLVQPELTCYRRNLFQISGTVSTPRGSLSVMTERGERIPIMALEVSVSASESVDGHPVKLIVIPWKTPPPNSPEIGQGGEHEPAPIPLLPFDEGDPDTNSEISVYPIAYRRLQFRIATANNGRRRELQQHFTLHLNIVATLANGSKTNICENTTAPIVVRGRSPRNFQARKEIPLVGSSSSRGGLPDLHVTTSIGPGPAPISAPVGKSKVMKPQILELPRSSFTFESSQHLPSSPSLLRTSTYPTYLTAHQSEHSTSPNTPSYPPTSIGLDSYLQVTQSNPDLSHSHSPTGTIPGNQPLGHQQQYNYQPSLVSSPTAQPVRFIDNNPRPAKSPRHVAPPELPSNASYSEYGARFVPPYNGSADTVPQRDPGYFPTSISMQAWTTAPGTTGAYGTAMQAPVSNVQHYEFPNETYAKEESHTQQNYTWNPA